MADGVCSVMVAREIVALSVKVQSLAFPPLKNKLIFKKIFDIINIQNKDIKNIKFLKVRQK